MMPSTPTEALLDVNVLIAVVFSDHVMHQEARAMVAGLTRFYTTPMTQGGFLRFATRPWKTGNGEEQSARLKMAEARAILEQLIRTEGHGFLADDSSFTELDPRALQGHRQWDGCVPFAHCQKAQSIVRHFGWPHVQFG